MLAAALALLLVAAILVAAILWLRNAVLDRRQRALEAKYPLLALPDMPRRERRAYVRELIRREQEQYDENKHERFVDVLKRTTHN